MSTAAHIPDLFSDQPDAAPRNSICSGPIFDYEAKGWQEGWWGRENTMADWTFKPYDQAAMAWIKKQLAEGRLDYREILGRRRAAQLENVWYVADIMFSHLRYLVLTGEILESKHYYGSPDPRSRDYRGWHPLFQLAGGTP